MPLNPSSVPKWSPQRIPLPPLVTSSNAFVAVAALLPKFATMISAVYAIMTASNHIGLIPLQFMTSTDNANNWKTAADITKGYPVAPTHFLSSASGECYVRTINLPISGVGYIVLCTIPANQPAVTVTAGCYIQ